MSIFSRRRPQREHGETEDVLREQLTRLERETSQMADVISHVSEGVLLLDSDGRVAFLNPAFRELFGISEELGQITGRTVADLIGVESLDQTVARVRRSRVVESFDLDRPTGSSRTASTHHLTGACAPLGDGNLLVTVRDISDAWRLEEARRDLAANLSHEIKTPLTAIRGFAETLQEGAIDDPTLARRFTERILQQCQRLQALLSDVLTLARVERQQVVDDPQPVNLEEIVRDAMDTLRPLAEEKRITLETQLAPARISAGDPRALAELCGNLLDNAVKYNREGGRVDVRLVRLDEQVLFEVADTGVGIPPKSVPRIFERFYRVDRGRSRAEGGTGLGLAIAKHAAEAHGGSIEVESELGAGSRFRVYLPA